MGRNSRERKENLGKTNPLEDTPGQFDWQQRKRIPTPQELTDSMLPRTREQLEKENLQLADENWDLTRQNEQLQKDIIALQQNVRRALTVTANSIEILGCEASAAGLEIPDTITQEDMDKLTGLLFGFEDRVQLYIGDMLVAREKLEYGDIKELASQYKKDEATLYKWKSICKAVKTFLRRKVLQDYPDSKGLTISHYELIMTLDEQQQEHFMREALGNGWSVSQLRAAVHQKKIPASTEQSYLDSFWRGFHSFIRQQQTFFREASPNERRQVIDALEKLIEDLRNA